MSSAQSRNLRNALKYLLPSENKRIFRVELPGPQTPERWKMQIGFLTDHCEMRVLASGGQPPVTWRSAKQR